MAQFVHPHEFLLGRCRCAMDEMWELESMRGWESQEIWHFGSCSWGPGAGVPAVARVVRGDHCDHKILVHQFLAGGFNLGMTKVTTGDKKQTLAMRKSGTLIPGDANTLPTATMCPQNPMVWWSKHDREKIVPHFTPCRYNIYYSEPLTTQAGVLNDLADAINDGPECQLGCWKQLGVGWKQIWHRRAQQYESISISSISMIWQLCTQS